MQSKVDEIKKKDSKLKMHADIVEEDEDYDEEVQRKPSMASTMNKDEDDDEGN